MNRLVLFVCSCAALAAPRAVASQEAPFELEGLVISVSPTPRAAVAVGRSVTVLDAESLRRRGLGTVAEALRQVVGLSVVRGGSLGATTSVFARGGESDYVQVLIDGVEVNQPGGAFDFAGLVLDGVERIEVVRGPASSLFGSDAVAGVVHIVTRTGRGPPSVNLGVRAGSYGRRDLSLGLSGGSRGSGWSVSLARVGAKGLLPLNNEHRNTVVTGSARVVLDPGASATLSVRLADRTYGFPTDGSGAVVDRNAFTFWDEASVGVSLLHRVRPWLQVRGRLGLHQTDGGTDDQPDGPADTLGAYGYNSLDHMRRTQAEVQVHAGWGAHTATLGGSLSDQSVRAFSESRSQWGRSLGRSDRSRWNRSLQTHLHGDFGSLSYGLGGRAEMNERFGRSTTWNAEAAWRLRPGLRLRGSAGTAVKEPGFYESFAEGFVRGNPDLRPEVGRSWDLGLEGSHPNGTSFSVGYFSQSYRDLIQYTATPPSEASPNFFNVAGAHSSGLELEAEAGRGPLTVGGGWTWLRSEVVDAGFEGGAGDAFMEGAPLLRRPSHAGFLRLGAAGSGGAVWLSARYVGSREDRDFATYPATRVTLEDALLIDVGLERTLTSGLGGSGEWSVSLRFENLLDRAWEEVEGFPTPGRSVMLGARATLGG